MELGKYRYLPLHLAMLHLSLTTEHLEYYVGVCKLTTHPRYSHDVDSGALALSVVHGLVNRATPYRTTYDLASLNLRKGYLDLHRSWAIDIFKTPLYTFNTNPEEQKEKRIIFSRNKKLRRLITSLVRLYALDKSREFNIPFAYTVPYLYFNPEATLITDTNSPTNLISLKYDPQTSSLKTKELGSTNVYFNKLDLLTLLYWYDHYIEAQLHKRVDLLFQTTFNFKLAD